MDEARRKRLFHLMNELPTIFEVVAVAVKKHHFKEKSSVSNHSINKSILFQKRRRLLPRQMNSLKSTKSYNSSMSFLSFMFVGKLNSNVI